MEEINSNNVEETASTPKTVKGIDTSSGENPPTKKDSDPVFKESNIYKEKVNPGTMDRARDYMTTDASLGIKNNFSLSVSAASQFTPVDIAKGIRDPNERYRYITDQGSKMTELSENLVGISFDNQIEDYAKYRHNQYDTKVAKFLDDLDENQGFWEGLGNFGGKLLGRTATAVSGIIPAVYGIGSAIINMDSKKLYENGAYDAWEEMDTALDKYFVVYGGDSYTAGEEKNVFARFKDNPMKSLADDFAPTIAFVAGAVGTSYLTGGVGAFQAAKGFSYINGLSKVAAKTNLVFKNGVKWARGIKNFEDVAQYSNFVNKYSKGLGTVNQMVLSASYESALIARDTKNSTSLNSKINYIKDNPNLAKEYDNLVRESMDEFGNMDKSQEELVEELSKKIPKHLLRKMEYASEQAGNLAFFTNVPLVGASNLIQFSKAFNTSYKAGQSLITKASMNPLKGAIKTAEGKAVTAASQAGKFKKVVGYTGIVLKPGLTEAFEEFSQGVIEKGYSDYYALEFKDGAIEDTKDFLKSIGTQASLYANSVEGFDSVALGFLMGMVGLPLGISRDSKTGKTKIGFGFTGGIKESLQEFKEELSKTESAVEHYNKKNFNEVLKNNLTAGIKEIQIQKELDKYAEEENIFDYKNAEFQQIYNFIENRIKNEIGETVFQDIDALEEMSLEQFNKEFAFKDDSLQFTKKTKKQAIESMRTTAESIVKAHEDVNSVLKYKRGFIDKLFKTDFEGLSNTDQFITESLTDQMKFLYASGLNLRKREEELTQRMSDLTKGKLNVSELGVKLREKIKTNKDGNKKKVEDEAGYLSQEIAGISEKGKLVFADQVAELKKMIKDQVKFDRETEIEYNKNSVEIDQITEDIVKLRDSESKTWEIYKTLFTPKGAKKFAEIKAQLVLFKAIELQKLQAEEQKEELAKKKSSNGAAKSMANATSTNNGFIVEEALQKDLQEADRILQEYKAEQEKNKEKGTPQGEIDLFMKTFEAIQNMPVLFAKIKEIANNSDEYLSIFSDEVIDLIQGNGTPEAIDNDRKTTSKILSELIKENKEANNKPSISLDYANEEDSKPFVNSITPASGSTKENHDANSHLSLKERLQEKLKKAKGKNYVKPGTTASDKTTILMYSDKIGKTGLIPDGNGGYIAVNNDMPITEASNKKVNDGTFLSNEELKDNNVRATFKLVEDSPFIKELKEKNNYNETTAPIDVYYGDTFIGRLPGSSYTNTPEQLRNLRKALFKQLTADEAVSQEAPGVYTGYKSTIVPTALEALEEELKAEESLEFSSEEVIKDLKQQIKDLTKTETKETTIEDIEDIEAKKADVEERRKKSLDNIYRDGQMHTGFYTSSDGKTSKQRNLQKKRVESMLNILYDYDIADIEKRRSAQQTTSPETENIKKEREALDKQYAKDAQIADIEKRRKEELNNVTEGTNKNALAKSETSMPTEEETIEEGNRILEENKDLVKKLEDPSTSDEEFDILEEELSEKFRGTSADWTLDVGKTEKIIIVFNKVGHGTINNNYTNSQQDRVGKYVVGDELQVDNGATAQIAKVTKVSSTGRVLEAKLKADGTTVVIQNGTVLAPSEVLIQRDINAKYNAELAALKKETTSPETEVEQTAREKVIGENFEDIIKALTANPIMQGDEFIGEKKC